MKSLQLSLFTNPIPIFRILLLFVSLLAGTETYAQSLLDQKLNLNLSDVTIREALDDIGRQAGCTFSYTSTLLQTTRRVSIRQNNVSVQDALKTILGNALHKLQVQGNQIHIQTVEGGGKGHLKGSVKTSDGQPGAFVNIAVKGTGKGAVTDEQGNYLIKNVAEGQQTVIARLVGYASVERYTEVRDGQTVEVPEIQLNEDSQTLQEVLVNGNINRFESRESDYVAKMPLKNLENPQVYTTVTGALIKEQLTVTYSDALRNVPGVVMMLENNSAGGSVTSRGFSTQSFLRNGVPAGVGSGSIDPSNIQSIEAIKGPSGSLYGSSLVSFGGLFNRITKMPFEFSRSEVTYARGGYGLSRLTVDVNTPLNKEKTVLLRVNAARHNEGSFQDAGFKSYSFVSPVLVYKINSKTTATIEGEYRKEKSNSFYRLFVDGSYETGVRSPKDLKIDFRRRFYGDDILVNTGNANLYLKLDHTFSSQWSSRTNITYLSSTYDGMTGYMSMKAGNDSLSRSLSYAEYSNAFATDLQQNFLGDFKIGNMQNRLLIGLEYYTSSSKASQAPTITYDVVGAENPGKAYTSLNRLAALDKFKSMTFTKGSSQQNIYSAYVQEVLNITKQLALLASLRVDFFDNKGTKNLTTGIVTNKYDQTALSPKLGLTYQILPEQLSLFGNYMNGFQNIAPVTQPDGNISTFKPSQANQWEAGLKFELLRNKLSGSVSYYDIAVTNVTRADYPDRPTYTVQDGDQYSKGFETQLVLNVLPGLSVFGGYAYNDSKYKKINVALDGYRPSSSGPAHTANVWASYNVNRGALHGLGFGLGGNYAGANQVILTSTSAYTLPSYTILGAAAFYSRSRFQINCKIDNLTNQRYWVGWGTTIQQMPSRFTGSLTVKF